MTVAYERLEAAVPAGALLALDTSATLSYLVGTEPTSPVTTWLFDGCISTGRNAALLSTITAAELLVRPFRAGPHALATAEGFLRFFGEIRVAEVSYAIAREAARIRAVTGISMPDALILATATVHAADVIVTDDRRWIAATASLLGDVRLCVLGDFVGEG